MGGLSNQEEGLSLFHDLCLKSIKEKMEKERRQKEHGFGNTFFISNLQSVNLTRSTFAVTG